MTNAELYEKREDSEEVGMRLEHRDDGQLWAIAGARECPVWVRRCFPWSAPERFVSLRDGDEEEVALVRDLAELGDDSRRALERALAEAGFVIEVEGVEEVEDEIEIRSFRVRTANGVRSFQTLRDEWPRTMPGGALLIVDVAGDLYRVADPEALDRKSRKRLAAFIG
jgi:hypothetical protein